jgi:hypothetical protein
MDGGFYAKKIMTTKRQTKLVHEGDYMAEVSVDLISDDNGWAPYLSPEDADKLDTVREALRKGAVESISRMAKVYSLTPVAG